MGQPSNIQPKEPIASLFVGSSGGSGASAVGPGNNLVAENGADNTVPQQLRIYGSKVRHGNNEDEHAPPTVLRQHQLMAKSAVNGPRQNTVGGDAVDYGAAAAGSIGVDGSFGSANMYVNNPQWGDKCYILEESDTNITAQDEYAKFDFQVRNERKKNRR